MPKPASVPTWATDANYTNGPTGIPGTATKVEPSAGQKAEGWIPKNKMAAQWLNWFKNAVGGWLVYLNTWFDGADELVYPVTKTRVVVFSWAVFQQMYADSTPGQVSGADAIPPWNEIYSGSAPDQYVDGLQSQSDFAKLMVDLGLLVPSGATITKIRALVNPGVARATAGNRMRIKVYDNIYNFSATTVGGTGSGPKFETTDDGTTNLQKIDTGTISLPLDKNVNAGGCEVLMVVAGNDASSNKDLVYAVEITYTDPGPRNY